MMLQYFCRCCAGDGKVPEVRYVSFSGGPFTTEYTGNNIQCSGCDGSGISIEAQRLREKDGVI
jgi:hypothetical protein